MTLLGILFVVGVAFLATMNFEADMISAEKLRSQSDAPVDAAAETAGAAVRNAIMAGPGTPFGDSSVALAGTAFAEMPGVQNTFSSIEPIRRNGPDGLPFTADDAVVFNGYFDSVAKPVGSNGSALIPDFYIDTAAMNGASVIQATFTDPSGNLIPVPLGLCSDGRYRCDINTCIRDPQRPNDCIYARIADADGDGIVDSLLVDAKELGISDAQLGDLAARVNPASNLSGKISVALRVVPHGGMVNLNASHPTLIQNVFDLQSWPAFGDPPDYAGNGGFVHGPSQARGPYSSMMEEGLLRRRNNIPPRDFQPSMLHGNPMAGSTVTPDMAWMLFWPDWDNGGAAAAKFQSASGTHHFTTFSASDMVSGVPNTPYWTAMMDPVASLDSAPIPWNASPGVAGSAYDRRHLVTTVSHDDLLARPGSIATPRGKQDSREAMIEANWTSYYADDCAAVMPFEYVNYPSGEEDRIPRRDHQMQNYCCPNDSNCRPGGLKGRLKLSLPWIDEQLNILAANIGSYSQTQQNEFHDRLYHIIHDVFYMLVRNATQAVEVEGMACRTDADCPVTDTFCPNGFCVHRGNLNLNTFAGCTATIPCAIPDSMCRSDGICTLAAPAWRDKVCVADADCGTASEFCLIPTGAANGFCTDRWTKMRRSDALVARTAASLTANMIDFVDNDDVPTQVAIRNFETITKCNGGTNHLLPCANDGDCLPNGACKNLFGRDIDLDPTNNVLDGVYVYGLERHPYITEVATLIDPGPVVDLAARAIEIFNPYLSSITSGDPTTNDEYFIYEVDPAASFATAHVVALGDQANPVTLTGNNGLNPGPFTTFYWEAQPNRAKPMLGTPVRGATNQITGPLGLKFQNGWILYLARRIHYPSGVDVDVVVDQFVVRSNPGAGNIGNVNPNPPCDGGIHPAGCFYSVERVVTQQVPWTASVPWTGPETPEATTLGFWNGLVNQAIHPVEVQFANTGAFGYRLGSTVNASFPTTGSLTLLMRNADRAITDFTPPPVGVTAGSVRDLAFNTVLAGKTLATANVLQGANYVPRSDIPIEHFEQIDNGRLPIFDAGSDAGPPWGRYFADHIPPSFFKPWDPTGTNPNGTNKGLPGDLNTLPWGQLLFDYFTALPLSNGGPYDIDTAGNYLSIRDMPKVDEGGLRVHGRININAAPWKVLAGLPFVPMTNKGPDPTVTFAGLPPSIQAKIAPVSNAGRLGPDLAQAIVAYRDARAFTDPATGAPLTGNYDDGQPGIGVAPNITTFGRGWTNPVPAFRRGTGFMSVGELANVRHMGVPPPGTVPPVSPYRIDYTLIDLDNTNNNTQDFIDAAAVMIALGDWVSVRSHVFTVYGQVRGADDPTIADPVQQRLDTDARAIRFQETIDRLPVLQGAPRPQRIGQRTVGKYTDVNND